jgi:P4 family phage/plasmid primase-like protien
VTDEVDVPSVDAFLRRSQDQPERLTEMSFGQYMVDRFGEVIRYVPGAQGRGLWYVWTGNHWVQDEHRAVGLVRATIQLKMDEMLERSTETADRGEIAEEINRWETMARANAIMRSASLDLRVRVQEEDFDAQPNLLVCMNGTVDLETGVLRRSQPKDLNSRCTAVDYVPEARSDLLDQFLETFLPDPLDQRFVFAILGNALRGGNGRRMFPIIWGDSTSGKSQLFAALHRLAGTYICTIGPGVFRGNLDDKPRPDLVMAMYTRLAYAMEASKSWALHADQIKRLTGEDTLPYRNLYAGIVNVTPRFTPILVTNVMPRITNVDAPTRRRTLVIHFDKSLPVGQEDPSIRKRFIEDPATLRALLSRLVAGARDPIIETPPSRFVLATMDASNAMDHIAEFLAWAKDEGFIQQVNPDGAAYKMLRTRELYNLHKHWLVAYGDKDDKNGILSERSFNEAMLVGYGWEKKISAGTRWLGWSLSDDLPVAIRVAVEMGTR